MVLKKQGRSKPLWNKILRLKQFFHNPLKISKLKRKKWDLFKLIRKKKLRRRFRIIDYRKYPLPWFTIYYKKKYKFNLQMKQKINLFFGFFLKKYLKKNLKIYNTANKFLVNLEKRIDMILYRSFFSKSIKISKYIIVNKHLHVNKKLINKTNFLVKKGDCITISKKIKNYIIYNIKSKSDYWPFIPNYLHINYNILQIRVIKNIEDNTFNLFYPTRFSVDSIKNLYKIFFFSSSEVEQMAVNHLDVGSNPTCRAFLFYTVNEKLKIMEIIGFEPITSYLQNKHSTD